MTAEVLGRTMQHQIGATLQRILVDGCSEGVVHRDERAGSMRSLRQAPDVDDLDGWIGGGLEIQKPAAATNFRLDALEIARVAQADLDAERGQEFGEQLVRAPITVLDGDDALTGAQQREERSADSRHAGSEAGGRFRPLQVPDLLLEGAYRWVGIARIDVSGSALLGDGLPGLDVAIPEGDAVYDRHLGGAFVGLVLGFPAPDRGRGSARCRTHGLSS